MWTTRRFQVDGGGVTQKPRARIRQTTTAICLFETEFLTLAGRHRTKGQRDGAGGIQKVDEESELADDEEEEFPDGRANGGIDV